MYRKLLPYLARYRWRIVGSSLCSVAEAIFELMIPLVLAVMLDDGIASGNVAYALRLGGEMLLLAVLVFLCGILSVRLATTAGTGFSADLRQAQFAHIQKFSFRNIEQFGATSLMTRLTTDVTAVQTAVFQCVKQLVRSSSMVLVAMVLSVRLCRQLSPMFFVLVPVMIVLLAALVLRSRPLYSRLQQSTDALNLITQEDLTGIRTVKAYVREEDQSSRFRAVNERFFRAADKAFGVSALGSPMVTVFTYICMLLLLGLGSRMVMVGTATVGQLTGFITYITQVFAQLMSLANAILLLNRSIVSAQRINEVLDTQPELTDGALDTPVTDGSLTFSHVSFAYGAGGNVLEDISFQVKAGQTVGILGGTGSGKSTLVQLIPRLYDAAAGEVLVGGQDVRTLQMSKLRQAVAMVLQTNTLFSGTIRENLQWGAPDATDAQLDEACRVACASEFIQRFPDGYDTVLGQDGVNLSGGQRQRLCLARALLQQPEILILDDSTSAVDLRTDAAIRTALRQSLPQTTKLIIAQRISAIREADLILVLEDGRLAAMGTHETLLAASPLYQQMVSSQQEGGL
jgi:ATP-binding cassette subfamily B protein